MAENFLRLPDAERTAIFNAQATELGIGPALLEKDIWVCWALKSLFEMDGALPMAFKGGTSLSKVYDAINRFSEDVDITIDHAALRPDLDPFVNGISRTALKRMTVELNAAVIEHIVERLVPYLESRYEDEIGDRPDIVVDETQQSLSLPYPAVAEPVEYVAPRVLLEFGGRNAIEPGRNHTVSAYIESAFPELEFPKATVSVLAPERTFWEKATLIHVECNRGPRQDANRLSRHWYDLFMLSGREIGERALVDRDLLEDVVRYKSAFFHSGRANYSACLNGGFRLIPDDRRHVNHLRADYRAMSAAGMFTDTPPAFEELTDALSTLQEWVNQP